MSVQKIAKLLESREREASIDSLADAWLDNFGGISGVMKELRLLFDCETISKAEKVKILISGIDLIKEASAKKRGRNPVEELSDEELLGAYKHVTNSEDDDESLPQ
jgi:hypothetical protein